MSPFHWTLLDYFQVLQLVWFWQVSSWNTFSCPECVTEVWRLLVDVPTYTLTTVPLKRLLFQREPNSRLHSAADVTRVEIVMTRFTAWWRGYSDSFFWLYFSMLTILLCGRVNSWDVKSEVLRGLLTACIFLDLSSGQTVRRSTSRIRCSSLRFSGRASMSF